jgi:MFS family permease
MRPSFSIGAVLACAHVTDVPLRRNRDFVLLQAGQLLSAAGTQTTSVAYPLLTLALTHSPAKAGLVGFARAVPLALAAIPGGAAADRWPRKRLMIGADVVRAAAVAWLAVEVARHALSFWMLPAVAAIEGAGASVFYAAAVGALRAVVPIEQLPAATATQTARRAVAEVVGPPVGGVLFAAGHALPFVADAASYACSTAALTVMRTPFEESRPATRAGWRADVTEGFRFLWNHPFLRTTALIFGVGNFIGPGLLFSLVVIARTSGVSSTVVGLLVGAVSAAIIVGSSLSGFVRARLPVRAVLVLELWAAVGCAAFLLRPSPYVLCASLMPWAFVIPSTDSLVHGYRLAMTPDRILGRSEAVRSTISLSVAPLGPLLAGLVLDRSPRLTVAMFAVAALGLAVWGTASPALRLTSSPYVEANQEGQGTGP